MRRANGTGSIKKLSGKRRNPYIAVVNFRNSDGTRSQRQVAPACRTKREAQAALDAWLATNVVRESELAFATLRTCIESALADVLPDLSKSTKSSYTRAQSLLCANEIADRRIADLRLADLQNVINQYEGRSNAYITNLMVVLRYGYKWALKNDIIAKDYSELVTKPKYKDKKDKSILTDGEIKDLWSRYHAGVEYADLALILLYTGTRIAEFTGLKPEDVHVDKGYIEVHGTKNAASDRIVPIHPDIEQIVANTIAKDCSMLDTNRIRKHTAKYGHTPHEYRHTFVTYANACGLEKVWLQKYRAYKL